LKEKAVAKAQDKEQQKIVKAVVTEHEQMLIRLAANLSGKSVGAYMKEIVLAQAEKVLKSNGVDVDKVKVSKPGS
jgi:uncharacterized protein (DUF1778 family)